MRVTSGRVVPNCSKIGVNLGMKKIIRKTTAPVPIAAKRIG